MFYAPQFFVENLPSDCTLDGELFVGRKMFNQTTSIIKSQDMGNAWKTVVYKIFDVPKHKDKPFEDRMKILEQMFPPGKHKYAQVVEQVKCKGKDHLNQELKRVQDLGGEGLMLRQPKSMYVGSRSATLLKVKTFEETEAIITGYVPGKGKYSGITGGLKCDLPNGLTFQVGSGLTDKERAKPPKIGTVITVRYQELTPAGIPRFPTYVGERIDVTWPPNKSSKSQ